MAAPRFNRSAWEKAALAEVDQRIGLIEEAVRETARGVVGYLAVESPVWTGWYVENHRVTLDGQVDLSSEPDPDERSAGVGLRALDEASLLAREEPTIAAFRLGDTIAVGNAVPYASDIETGGTKTTPDGMYYHGAHLYAEYLLSQQLR